jgi:zinc/manganese transport system ATP-binding protein
MARMPDLAPTVATVDVCFAYAGSDVLHDVSIDLRPGEVTAIAGPNGSGKSTLVEVIAGVRAPRRGSVRRRGDLGLVVQRPDAPEALPVTAADVVAMGTWKRGSALRGSAGRRAVVGALERVGLAALANRPLTELSGGQRQRVFLAQGIVRRPDIILLDEPAAGLDRESVARTHQILRDEAARGAIVVCVTHDDDAIAAAHRVIRLEGGVLVD